MSHSGHLTIIGAGPKAVAIAAKRRVLEELEVPVPELCVIDGRGTGAHWTGEHGYTDGSLPLGTPPEKDVGFPYSAGGYKPPLGQAVNTAMLKYSWGAFHILDSNHSYAEWVDRGKPNPRHEHWAEYLRWVAEQVGMEPKRDDLRGIELVENRWRLRLDSGEELMTDGIVVTSPGPPRSNIEIQGSSEWIADGRSFWLRENKEQIAERIKKDGGLNACVIGSGETAAAIVVELDRLLPQDGGSIAVISKEGIIYTRGESYEENRLYSSPAVWREFPEDVRRQFVKRTDRGVFSVGNKAVLNRAEIVTTLAGEVKRIESNDDGLALEFANGERREEYDLVVDATGFQVDWFFELMGPEAQRALTANIGADESGGEGGARSLPGKRLSPSSLESLSQAIGVNLAVEGLSPPLHLPMLAALKQGPGFPNLSSLGLLSDRVLQSHCPREIAASPNGDSSTADRGNT